MGLAPGVLLLLGVCPHPLFLLVRFSFGGELLGEVFLDRDLLIFGHVGQMLHPGTLAGPVCVQANLRTSVKELSNTGPRGSGGVVEALGSRHRCS